MLATRAVNFGLGNVYPEHHHVEASSPGSINGNFVQYFGVLVNPANTVYRGRVQLVVGCNGLASAYQGSFGYPAGAPSFGYTHGAGGSFDVFTPIGRPIVAQFVKLT
jgi:hypothetical protein